MKLYEEAYQTLVNSKKDWTVHNKELHFIMERLTYLRVSNIQLMLTEKEINHLDLSMRHLSELMELLIERNAISEGKSI
jgi:hypothetical protein